MTQSDHERLLAVCRQWEVMWQRRTEEVAALREALTAVLEASLSVAGHDATAEDWNVYCDAAAAARLLLDRGQ